MRRVRIKSTSYILLHLLIWETARSVQLYQRLTRVIAKLADGVEAELQKRMADLDNRARRASESMDQLNPQIDQLREGLAKVEEYLSRDMRQAVKESSEAIKDGLGQAEDLHQVLAIMLKAVLEGNSQVAVAHEQSLELATNRANDEMGGLMAVIAGAVASSATLQNQIVSHFWSSASHLASNADTGDFPAPGRRT